MHKQVLSNIHRVILGPFWCVVYMIHSDREIIGQFYCVYHVIYYGSEMFGPFLVVYFMHYGIEISEQLRFQKRKTPTADFLINISSLDILTTLLYQCRSESKLYRRVKR